MKYQLFIAFILISALCRASIDPFEAIENYDTLALKQYFEEGGDIDQVQSQKVELKSGSLFRKKLEVTLFEQGVIKVTYAHESNDKTNVQAAKRNFEILLEHLNESDHKEEHINRSFGFAISTSDVDFVRMIYTYGADINLPCELCYGRTPALIGVAYNSDIEMMKFLMSLEPDLSIKDNDGRGYLHYAAMNGNVRLLEYLLKQNVEDINEMDHLGRTPLMYTLLNEHIEAYDFLLAKGADVKLYTKYGVNALHLAAFSNDFDLFRHVYYTSGLPLWESGFYARQAYGYTKNYDIQLFIERETIASTRVYQMKEGYYLDPVKLMKKYFKKIRRQRITTLGSFYYKI